MCPIGLLALLHQPQVCWSYLDMMVLSVAAVRMIRDEKSRVSVSQRSESLVLLWRFRLLYLAQARACVQLLEESIEFAHLP